MFRVTFKFSQQGDRLGGWGENYWNSRTSHSDVFTAANNLAPLLQQCHGNDCNLIKIRIQDDTGTRSVRNYTWKPKSNAHVPNKDDADYQTTGILLRFESLQGTQLYTVNEWMTGTPDNVVTTAGVYKPVPSFNTAFQAYRTAIVDQNQGWRLKVTDQGQAKKAILNIDQAGVVTVTAHGYDPNNLVRISRVVNPASANGLWKIAQVIDANTFKLLNFVPLAAPPVYQGTKGTYCRKILFIPVPITQLFVVEATSHRRGRVGNQLTGRRRGRKK